MTPYNPPILASRFASVLPLGRAIGLKALRGVAQPGRAPRSGHRDRGATPQKTLSVLAAKCVQSVYRIGTNRHALASSLPPLDSPVL